MENERTYYTKEMVINQNAQKSDDPRIDSPQIKVVYPKIEETEPNNQNIPTQTPNQPSEQTNTEVVNEQPKQKETSDHVCTTSIQKAIEQNWMAFSLMGIAILGIGYFIGKSKSV